jgi:hypothetical protein
MTKEQIAEIWDRYFEIVSEDDDDVVPVHGELAEKLKALIAEAPYQGKDPMFCTGFWTYEDGNRAFEISLHLNSGESAICDADVPDVDKRSDRLDKLRWAQIRALLTVDEANALVECAEAMDQFADECESQGNEVSADELWTKAGLVQSMMACAP